MKGSIQYYTSLYVTRSSWPNVLFHNSCVLRVHSCMFGPSLLYNTFVDYSLTARKLCSSSMRKGAWTVKMQVLNELMYSSAPFASMAKMQSKVNQSLPLSLSQQYNHGTTVLSCVLQHVLYNIKLPYASASYGCSIHYPLHCFGANTALSELWGTPFACHQVPAGYEH